MRKGMRAVQQMCDSCGQELILKGVLYHWVNKEVNCAMTLF